MQKFLRFLMLAVLFLPFALQAQNTQIFDFEDDAIPADWTNDATYPWIVTNTSQGDGHSGTYCLMSSNAGVSNSTSTISATFTFVGDGSISFLGGIYGEGSSTVYDKCIFTIDGVQQFAYGALDTWATYTYELEAGIHTFTWSYTKDNSVNPTGDAFFIDNVTVDLGVAASCARPLAIALGDIDANSISITWTPGGDETAWKVFLYDNDGELVSGYPADATIAEYTFDGLTANTPYTIGVKANCGSELSAERTITARTACDAITSFPWNEDFESIEANSSYSYSALYAFSEPCWMNEHISGNGSYLFEVSTYNTTGNTTHQLRLPDMTSGTMTKLVLPLMDLPSGTNYMFSIDVFRNATGTSSTSEGVRVYASTNGEIEGATELGFLYRNCTQTDGNVVTAETTSGWYTYEFTIPFTGNCYIILRGESTYGSATYMDNFSISEAPSCIAVTGLTVDDVTANSITLSWSDEINTGANYIIYDMTDTSEVYDVYIEDNTALISNLDANTTYTFGVAADCGGDIATIRTISGRTACAAMALPIYTSFEDADLQGTTSALLFPHCWTRINTLTSDNNYFPYAYNYGSTHTGARSLYFYAYSYSTYADTTGFVLPELDINTYPMNANRVTFWAKVTSTTDYLVQVGTMTDPTDLETFTLIETVTVTGTDYTKYAVSLADANDEDAYVAFIVPKVYSTMYIDDVTLEVEPNCPDVTGLTLDSQTATSANISWNDNGATEYEIEVSQDNEVLTDVTVFIIDTTAEISGLEVDNDYQVKVRAICGSDNGAWTLPLNIHIGYCTPAPSSVDNNGITSVSFGGMTNTTTHPTSAPYYGDYSTMSGTVPAGLTATVDITYATGYTYGTIIWVDWNNSLSFDADEVVYRGTSTNDNPTTLTATFDIPATTEVGDYRMRIAGADSYFDGAISDPTVTPNPCFTNVSYSIAEDYTLTISEAPDCLPVTGLTANNVSGHTATLTWEGDATSYNVYVVTAEGETLEETVYDNTIELTGLAAETSFTYGVKTNCGGEESIMTTVTFTTLISCPVPTALTAVLTPGDGTVATLNWTESGIAEAWQICINGDTNDLIDVYENTYDMTDLTPETAYTAMVRANCGDDDQSAWSNPITFTPTDAYFLTVNDGTETNSYVPIYGTYVDNYTKSQFIIPATDLTTMLNGMITKLTFYASNENVNWGAAEFNVYLTETDATTLSALADYNNMTQVYAGSLSINNNKMEVSFNSPYLYMGGNLMIGFNQTVSGTWSSCYWYGIQATGASMGGYGSSINQKNFLPKTSINFIPGDENICLPVTGLTVSDVTADGATLTWTSDAGSYTIYDMSDTSVVATISDETYDFADLDAMTHYSFGVAANCGNDQSMIMKVSFNTACSAIELPYTETFEDNSGTVSCWTNEGSSTWTIDIGDYSTSTGAYEGSKNAKITHSSNGNVTKFISPVLDGAEDGLLLNFAYVMRQWINDIDELRVYTRADADSTWQMVGEYTAAVSTWTEVSIPIPNAVYQVAFEFTDGYGYGVGIDNVAFTALGDYCLPVTDITVDNSTTTSILLSWTDNNNTGSYTIYDMADNSVVASNVPTTNYNVTGLSASTNYTFGVAANCSTDNESAISTIDASTECDAISTFPYTQEFNSEPACWTMIDADGDGYNWNLYMDGTTPVFNSRSYDNDIGVLYPDNWLISPQFQLTAGTSYEATWKANPQDLSYAAEHYGFYVSTTGNNDTAAFTLIQEWTLTASDNPSIPVIDMSAYAGQNIYVAFRHWNCSDEYWLVLDDFILREQAGSNQVVVNVTSNNAFYGTVSGGGVYNIGDNVTVTATPASSYQFSRWTDANGTTVSNDNPYTFVAATDITLQAVFISSSAQTYTITVDVNDSLMGTATGSGEYQAGDVAVFTATANPGYIFVNWTQNGNVLSTDNPFSMTVTSNSTSYPIVANFEADGPVVTTYTVTLNTDNATMGSVSPAGETTVNEGTNFTATATALDGYHFVAWMNGTTQVSTANPYTFTVTADITLTATFEAIQHTVTLNTADPTMGSVSPAGTNTVNEGTSFTATATAADGYHFVAWMNGTTQVSTANPYSFNVTADITLTATFEANDPTVNYFNVSVTSANTQMGTVNSTASGSVAENTQVTVTATALAGYQFVNWTNAAGTVVSTNESYTFTVTADVTLTAIFEAIQHTVTLNTADPTMGSVSPAGANTVNEGTSFTANATANAGYQFVNWTDAAGTVVSTNASYTFTVTADVTLTAIFEAIPVTQYTVTLNTDDANMGSVAPAGANTVNEGTSFTATATAADGYHFVAWMNGTTQVSDANPYTFTVTADITLTATFEANDPGVNYFNVSVTSANTEMGTVNSTASGSVAENTEVTATATPNPNYVFVNWTDATGTEVSTSASYTFTVTADVTLTANFAPEVGINDVDASNILIYAHNSTITVRGAEGNDIYVYDMNGRCIYQKANANETENISMASAGIYMVRVSNAIIKKVVVVK